MSTVLSTTPDGTLCLSGSLCIYDVEPVCHAMLTHLSGNPELNLDLDALTECDAAGIQLLLAARESAKSLGKRFSVRAAQATAPARASALGIPRDFLFTQSPSL